MKQLIFCLLMLFGLSLSAQTYTQLTNLPTVYINTTNSKAVTDKKTFVTGTWTMVDGDKTETITGLKIRCRGNSTFNNTSAKDKPAYRMKFDSKVALLGDKGVSDRNWVLMANHFDKSLIRNALTTDIMGRFAGMEFNPRRPVCGCGAQRSLHGQLPDYGPSRCGERPPGHRDTWRRC